MTKTNSETATETGVDPRLSVLPHVRRLAVLTVLVEHDGPIGFESLSERVATLEAGGSTPPIADVRDVRSTLFHVHLPKLREAGYVRYPEQMGPVSTPKSRTELLALVDTIADVTGAGWSVDGDDSSAAR